MIGLSKAAEFSLAGSFCLQKYVQKE